MELLPYAILVFLSFLDLSDGAAQDIGEMDHSVPTSLAASSGSRTLGQVPVVAKPPFPLTFEPIRVAPIVRWPSLPLSEPTQAPVSITKPTPAPTRKPTPAPVPTRKPTLAPVPTRKPTSAPTRKPTLAPVPTQKPTSAPTRKPSLSPGSTPKPILLPIPTPMPTPAPTHNPTEAVTPAPSSCPPTPCPPTATGEPAWYKEIVAAYPTVSLCPWQNNVAPPPGSKCGDMYMFCFFGNRYCINEFGRQYCYPETRCDCINQVWRCTCVDCPGPVTNPPGTIIDIND